LADLESEEGDREVKTYSAVFGLVGLFAVRCSAQEIKTVAECRAHREAWYTSADDDVKRLSVKELLNRAKHMITCGKEIDGKPIKADMAQEEGLNTSINDLGYPVLASTYYQEAFYRAAWFIDKKHLTSEFLADDKNGKIRLHTSGNQDVR
jgi:hypothetical protein